MGTRKQFTPEFKREAVQLVESGSRSASELARELRVRRNQLYKWQREFHAQGTGAFPGSGARKECTTEITRLKRELARVTEERDIVKKAAAGSSGESNTRLQYSRWRLKSQCLSRALIQPHRDPVQICL
jgi:transposase